MKELDMIREALKSAILFLEGLPCTCDYFVGVICEPCNESAKLRNALAALSTIDPDAKPKEDARKFAFDLCLNCVTPPDMNIDNAAALITAHDNAIRREFYEQIQSLPYPNDNPTERRLSDIAAILGKEAEK